MPLTGAETWPDIYWMFVMVFRIWDANMEIKLEVLKCFFERDFCILVAINLKTKRMNIYIDNFDSEDNFALKIIKRLKSIKYDFSITNYSMLEEKYGEITDEKIAKLFDNFDIIIPIVTSDYLVTNGTVIHKKLDQLADDKNKLILPVIYSPTNWSSESWIVKSKIFPEDEDTFSELDDNAKEITINKLVQTIENVLAKQFEPLPPIQFNKDAVFISHSHDDSDFAELLTLQLERNGVKCWMDAEKLKIGQDWRQDIDDAINNCVALIVIMTPEARKSEYVTYEWSYAWGKGKNIFPIMLKQTNLHPRLESLQYLDFTNRATRSWEKIIESLKNL